MKTAEEIFKNVLDNKQVWSEKAQLKIIIQAMENYAEQFKQSPRLHKGKYETHARELTSNKRSR